MSIKDQVTVEQWKMLLNAPSAASTFVSTASGGGFEIISEVLTASKFSADLAGKQGGTGYGMMVDEILAQMKGMSFQDARENSVKFTSTDPVSIRAEMKQFVTDAIAFASTLPEADGYKRWILDMVKEVAETKTGGILGFGGKSVIDEKEMAAISELAAILGIIEG